MGPLGVMSCFERCIRVSLVSTCEASIDFRWGLVFPACRMPTNRLTRGAAQNGDMEAKVTLVAVALTDVRPEAKDYAYRFVSHRPCCTGRLWG